MGSPDYCVGCNLMMLNHIWDYHHERPENETRRPAETKPDVPDTKARLPDHSPSSLHEITVDGISSYYTYSNVDSGSKKRLG